MNLPNGNLYKFVSFLGFLLFVSCVFIPYLKFDDNEKEINDIRRNLVVLNQEREALVKDVKKIESYQASNDSLVLDEFTSFGQKVSDTKKGIDLRTVQIGLENEILDEKIARRDDIKMFVAVVSIISFLITVLGLIFWYTKVQRPMNRVIRVKMIKGLSDSEE